MTKFEQGFVNDVNLLLDQTIKLLEERKTNKKGTGTIRELQTILNDLKKMKSQVVVNSLPESERFVMYESFIIEKWGIRNEYGNKLLDLARKYISVL